jgi:flavin-dependent dehydrogenase
VLTVKRLVLDARLARAAAAAGADLVEDSSVEHAELVELIAADGASSRLARSLGVVSAAAYGNFRARKPDATG